MSDGRKKRRFFLLRTLRRIKSELTSSFSSAFRLNVVSENNYEMKYRTVHAVIWRAIRTTDVNSPVPNGLEIELFRQRYFIGPNQSASVRRSHYRRSGSKSTRSPRPAASANDGRRARPVHRTQGPSTFARTINMRRIVFRF